MGLPGARRLMDEFDLSSTVGSGTTVTMRKWTR
jgi:serine/threonine-protein kinase RsbT